MTTTRAWMSPKRRAFEVCLTLPLLLAFSGCGRSPEARELATIQFNAIQIIQAARAEGGSDVLTLDLAYYAVEPVWVERTLQPLINQEMTGYRPLTSDCDDYSRAAAHVAAMHYNRLRMDAGPAYGQVVIYEDTPGGGIGKHAMNWFVDPQGKIWFHEPQNGKVWRPSRQEIGDTLWRWM